MKGYIDLHLHILPGLDDGPGDLETAEETARILVEQGFKAAVATPHCCEGRPSPAEIRSRLEQLQERLLRKNIHLQVYPGSELMMDPHLLERLEREESLTLAGSRYFLVEFPLHQPLPLNTRELLSQALVRGFIPVLAHPERT
ncbi:MAG: CpsB/CapC family capsule biosynthesis tyrosine phosphatase, partial [Dethiobacteria bacterium]